MGGRGRTETEPAYARLARTLRAAVDAGEFADGRRLPTEAELAARYGLSRQTVRRAFTDLVADGVVYRIAGRGTFAHDATRRYRRRLGSIEDLLDLAADTDMEIVEPFARAVDIDAAGRLRLDGDLVWSAIYRRVHRSRAFGVTTVHLPDAIAASVLDRPELRPGAVSASTVIGLLEPHLDAPIAEAAQSITVAAADEGVARALGCVVGHALLRVDRLYSTSAGIPVELSVSHFLPEQYTYRVTLRRNSSSDRAR